MTRNYSTNSNSFSLENKGKNKKKKTTVDRSKYTIEYPLNEIIIGLLLGDGHIGGGEAPSRKAWQLSVGIFLNASIQSLA